MRSNRYLHPHDQQMVSLCRYDWDEENVKRIFSLSIQETLQY